MTPVVAAALLGGALVTASAPASDLPLLLTGATVYTSWDAAPRRAAVLAVGGKIAFVGDETEARKMSPAARTVALPGAVVYPGFVDAHAHVPGLGMSKESLDLRGRSKEEILALVKGAAVRMPKGEWIRGRSWDQNLWTGKSFPTAAEIDSVAPKHPVLLTRVDGHALWVNGLAMERAGVTAATKDPDGGKILRSAGGEPSGIFIDNAEALIVQAIGEPTPVARRRVLVAGMNAAAETGLTGVGDASGFDRSGLEVVRTMAREKALPIRLYATVGAETKDLAKLLAEGMVAEGRLTVRAVKMYADGALGSRGAALLADYSDDPGNRGLLVTPPGKMDEIALACAKAGWQLWTHAIGDRGNRLALDAYEKAFASVKPKDPRFRIEHAQVVAPEDIPRFSKLGVIASIQPTHATSDMPWAEARVGPVRIRGAYAWRSLLSSGARLAGGSDFPVEEEAPLLGFYAAITRQDLSGRPPGGWTPDQKLTRREALRLFTSDAAYAEFAETRRGKIAPGFDADLTVLDRDIVADSLPVSEIPGAKVVMTVVDGEVVYRGR
ncbi:MAG: amidohydrolase [Thermoanaerobaculia bacterium]